MQNAKRGEFSEMKNTGTIDEPKMNLENKVDKNAISFDSGTVPNRGLIKILLLPFVIKVNY